MTDGDILPELISELLKQGHKVRFKAPGKSMQPAVLDGDVLIVEPVDAAVIKIGDIILYQAEAHLIAHRVKSIEKNENFYAFLLCGDASFSYDEPVYADQILGKAIAIERDERTINPYCLAYRFICRVRIWASRLKRIYF